MVTQTPITKKRPHKNGKSQQTNGAYDYRSSSNWPRDIEEAYQRDPGPYTAANVGILLQEEPLELYNGWLVWKPMTEPEERRVANYIQVILDLAARWVGFGESFPDLLECELYTGEIIKPDVCVISKESFEKRVQPKAIDSDHKVFKGSPEFVVEIRSPSNTRAEDTRKRQKYFDNGAIVIWDVDHEQRKIWVFEYETPEESREYTDQDEITCEVLLPGWKRKVADFFAKGLTAEEMNGQAAVEWRAESRAEGEVIGLEKGKAEGQLEGLRSALLIQAKIKFGETALPTNLSERLSRYDTAQLIGLVAGIATSSTLEEWLVGFPEQV